MLVNIPEKPKIIINNVALKPIKYPLYINKRYDIGRRNTLNEQRLIAPITII